MPNRSETDSAKTFINETCLLEDSFRLGKLIHDDGFNPTFIVGLWRGGSSVGIYVQECLQYLGVEADHISVRTSYSGAPGYADMLNQRDGIRVHGLTYLYENLNSEDNLLIVDDVYSSGSSVRALINRLQDKTRMNMPHDIRIAAPWYRLPDRENAEPAPHYYLHETRDWLVLPYELAGLDQSEIIQHKPGLADKLAQLKDWL